MTSRLLIAAAALALAAGCNARKQTNNNRAEAPPKEEKAATATDDHETVGEYGEKVADKTRDAAETTVEKTEQAGENAAEATRDAADDTLRETDRAQETVLGENETLPPERGVDTVENDEETPNPGEKNEDDVVADKKPEAIGTQVTASVASVDQKKEKVTFRIDEGVDEIDLQSGKEITVPFMDLQLLMGMQTDKALEALEKAGDVQVRVFGKGDSMRIVEIDMDEKKKDVDIEIDEKSY